MKLIYKLPFTNSTAPKTFGLLLFFLLLHTLVVAQVTAKADTTNIKIGEQITLEINVTTDSTNTVIFPEKTFSPFELLETYPIDTVKNKNLFNLKKKYALTKFDSGHYFIPKQKVLIANKPFFTDSIKIQVNNIKIDTTKQGLYNIKPIIGVNKSQNNWLTYALIILVIVALVSFLLYWFIWRKKPLSEEEKIALLPPYERAKTTLKKLDENNFLNQENIKEYYSQLTLILRKYLDEKIYNRALESTTAELIEQLSLLKNSKTFKFTDETIKNIESILQRADLVKFARSKPDLNLAELDRKTIEIELENVKKVLPEPTEEEKLLNEQYRQEQERKKKRKKIILTTAIVVGLLLATYAFFAVKYGTDYVKDKIVGHSTLELLEGEWVSSEYGYPPIKIETPKVLKRKEIVVNDSVSNGQNTSQYDAFYYGSMLDRFYIVVRSVPVKEQDLIQHIASTKSPEELQAISKMSEQEVKQFLLTYLSEESLKVLNQVGAKNILVKDEPYNGVDASGLKTFGSFAAINALTNQELNYNYEFYTFIENDGVEAIIFTYQEKDKYAREIINKVISSVRLKTKEE